MGQRELQRAIVELSVANTWAEARREWALDTVYFADEPETCLCGQYPIIELCVISNRLTHESTTVGNVCVNQFLGLPSNLIFVGIKRVEENSEAALNEAAIEYAHRQGWLNDWERHFCLDTRRKRNLSGRQLATRVQINEKVIRGVRKSRRPRATDT